MRWPEYQKILPPGGVRYFSKSPWAGSKTLITLIPLPPPLPGGESHIFDLGLGDQAVVETAEMAEIKGETHEVALSQV